MLTRSRHRLPQRLKDRGCRAAKLWASLFAFRLWARATLQISRIEVCDV